jgi:hypothetical protein
MFQSNYINQYIDDCLMLENEQERANHISSGKLSASMLGQPLQWMILKYLGVKPRDFDCYTLRKFERGRNVEDWIIQRMSKETDNVIETQKELEYRNTVGKLDILANVEISGVAEVLPVEVKSITNANYKWIDSKLKKGENPASRPHQLQAGLYGMAMQSNHFSVCYIASDDYRINHFIYDTDEVRSEVDRIISAYEQCIKDECIPVFVAEEKWQEDLKYNNYPDWMGKSVGLLKEQAKLLFEAKHANSK